MRISSVSIHWLGHDGYRLEAGPLVVYIDPFRLDAKTAAKPASLVLITHEHFDHCSVADLKRIATPATTVVCSHGCLGALSEMELGAVVPMRPGEKKAVMGIGVEAVYAYNTNKYRDRPTKTVFHPREDEKNGYVLDIGGTRIYHAGDTDNIAEMTGIECDVALLPVSGTYVMTPEEAAEAAMRIRPKVAVPMHYGAIIGDEGNAIKFHRLLDGSGIEVEILRKE